MSNIENDTNVAGIFLVGLVIGLLLGSAAGFTWAVVDLDESGSSTMEQATTLIAAEAAEVKPKPSAYEILLNDPAKYCRGMGSGL